MVERGSIIRVLKPGMLTTIQDLGRPGLAHFGVAPGGALDRRALILGNRLLGNDPGEAGLEVTLVGPTLLFTEGAVIAVTGADLGATRAGVAIPRWEPVAVRQGDELAFRPDRASRRGVRAYLSVAGGFVVEPVLGARSTDLVGRFGGLAGRALQTGDELPLRGSTLSSERLLARRLVAGPPVEIDGLLSRVVLGPQTDRFTEAGITTFLSNDFLVTTKADRTGVRLSGPAIGLKRGADLLSEGIAHGAVQVPGDGQPIVLLAARQTVGGYVKIATVIGADLDAFAQLRPGAAVRFATVTPAEARAATLAYRSSFGPDAVGERPRAFPGAAVGQHVGIDAIARLARAEQHWDMAAVVQLVDVVANTGVTACRIDIPAVGLKLKVRRARA